MGRRRRKEAERKVARHQVRYRRCGEEDQQLAFSVNVSPFGMFIGTRRPYRPGVRVVVEFEEDERKWSVVGVVRHSVSVPSALRSVKRSGMGIEFDRPIHDFAGNRVGLPEAASERLRFLVTPEPDRS